MFLFFKLISLILPVFVCGQVLVGKGEETQAVSKDDSLMVVIGPGHEFTEPFSDDPVVRTKEMIKAQLDHLNKWKTDTLDLYEHLAKKLDEKIAEADALIEEASTKENEARNIWNEEYLMISSVEKKIDKLREFFPEVEDRTLPPLPVTEKWVPSWWKTPDQEAVDANEMGDGFCFKLKEDILLDNVDYDEVVPFDDVLLDTKEGYNATSGVYTYKNSGLYLTLIETQTNQKSATFEVRYIEYTWTGDEVIVAAASNPYLEPVFSYNLKWNWRNTEVMLYHLWSDNGAKLITGDNTRFSSLGLHIDLPAIRSTG